MVVHLLLHIVKKNHNFAVIPYISSKMYGDNTKKRNKKSGGTLSKRKGTEISRMRNYKTIIFLMFNESKRFRVA
jgi:hypothetical protein